MKRLALAITFLIGVSLLYGQSNKVVSAWNYMKPQYNELDKAKKAIDEAAQHPKTSGDAKTWVYRGQVYQKLYHSKDEKFKNLDSNPLKQVYISYVKAYDLDVKKRYEKDIIFPLTVCSNDFFTKGSLEYEQKLYKESLESFETVIEIGQLPYINQLDTGAYFNAGLAADQAKEYDKAIAYYRRALELNYSGGGPDIFVFIGNIYKEIGDTTAALDNYKEGLVKFPDNVNLYIELINYYLTKGNVTEAGGFIEKALEKDPTNASLWFVYGFGLDENGMHDDAIAPFKKALELKPDYFEANYGIARIYYNKGVEANNALQDIPLDDQTGYDAGVKARDGFFEQALPYFENSNQIKPMDADVLAALKEIYYRFKKNDKLDEIQKLIDQLK